MKDESVTDALLRQFLLGKVNEEELERIEDLLLTDSRMLERVFFAEQDLIEDYLEDSLSSTDREAFVLHYAQTSEQQRKLRITRSIKDWAIAEDSARRVKDETRVTPVRQTAGVSMWGQFWKKLRMRPAFMVPIAAVIILAIVFAIVWLNRRMEHSAIEQEIARLNAPSSLRNLPPPIDALVLTPGTLRSGGLQRDLRLRADVPVVELHLNWITRERFPKYQGVVRRYRDGKTWTIPELHLEEDGKTIRLRLPTRILSSGLHQIRISGITADGTAGPGAEYQFMVIE